MRQLIFAVVFVSIPGAVTIGVAQSAAQSGSRTSAVSASGLDLAAIDRAADPCANFYQFACGGWTASHPIPPDRPGWGRFDELQERNYEILHRVLEAAASGRDGSSRRIGDYYASCMEEAAIEKKGATPLAQVFQKIAALSSPAALPPLLALLHVTGVNVFFQFGAEADFKDAKNVIGIVDQGGLGLPDRDYYFRDDDKSVEIRKQYVAHVAKMTALAGSAQPQASAAADVVMRIETALAKSALDRVARRDPAKIYHKLTVAELQALTPAFQWSRYFRGTGAPSFAALNVTEPDFFTAFGKVVDRTPLDDIKTYLRWHVVHAHAAVLSTAFVNENFQFYSKTLQGVAELRPRWKRCVQYTDSDLGEALGQAFVKEAFGPDAKRDTLDMVHAVETALEQDIRVLSWMSETTKEQALAKVHAVSEKIGYPDRWRDYSALRVVRGDALGNSQRANLLEFRRQMNRIGKPLDKSDWDMTPPTVNAYYNPLQNNINFPAGILQPPFYSAKADAAVNYGGSGAVIGHELTHGFDDEGRQFDRSGNLNDWWTPGDAKAFDDRASCFVDQYSKIGRASCRERV